MKLLSGIPEIKGATTLGDSNSVPTEDIWSGKTTSMAAKLESKFVGVGSAGKLAAGNLFVGKYAWQPTEQMSILNFGQSFSAYPTHLKGYYKYQPGVIDNSSIEYNYLKGRTDTCSIPILPLVVGIVRLKYAPNLLTGNCLIKVISM